MTIQERFESYEKYRCELEADICALADIGYDPFRFRIKTKIHKQSPDIAQGVNLEGLIGAGDQGIVYGYATDETPEYLPLAQVLARKLTRKLEEVREEGIVKGLKPDGKCLVVLEYEDSKASRVQSVVLSTQHDEKLDVTELRQDILAEVIRPVLDRKLPYSEDDIYINPVSYTHLDVYKRQPLW